MHTPRPNAETPGATEAIKPFTDDDLHYIACEVSHDLRWDYEKNIERIRWNNRAMARMLATVNAMKQSLRSI